MDRIWQWAWDRYGARYSWVVFAVGLPLQLWVWLILSFAVVEVEKSNNYVESAVVTAVAVVVMVFVLILPGVGPIRIVERWAAGDDVCQQSALTATYRWGRRLAVRWVVLGAPASAMVLAASGVVVGASATRLVEWGILGGSIGIAVVLTGAHSMVEAALRPARRAIAGDSGVGDSMPRSRPTFATWANVTVITVGFGFAASGVILGATFSWINEIPLVAVGVGVGMTLLVAVPLTIGALFSPSMQPIRDLADGTQRVAAGDYSQRLPVVQDDDLGALAASFNRMQAGLAERQRLQTAFGTYVDPALAARLLAQGDDVFTGERREVTVMFVDIRDFTPFAESNPAEDVVARLNALFEIVVPAVVDAGGHVNKFLGDGALAVFGAPNDLANHADAALDAAVLIQRLVAERFGGELRIGIGINTGTVIAGTIGGGSKLEFTLIGDTVNVAARVEQLTKTTGDTILLTEQSVDALTGRPPGLADRGSHALKGKSAAIQVFGL